MCTKGWKKGKFRLFWRIFKDTGKYIPVSTMKIGKLKAKVVQWTGKEREVEYWECNACYDEAMHELWLEEKIEKASVFARITPGHKLKIVNAFKKNPKILGTAHFFPAIANQ